MIDFIHKPLPGIAIVIILAFLDYPLAAIAKSSYLKYMSRYVHYDNINTEGADRFGILRLIMKIVLVVLLYGIWLVYDVLGFRFAGLLYVWFLGFAIGYYLIMNIGHLQDIMLARLFVHSDLVDGYMTYHPKFVLKISAIRVFSILVVFALFAMVFPGYFTFGLACSPFFLIIRNLLLA